MKIRRLLFSLGATLLMLSLASPALAESTKEEARDLIGQGQAQYRDGDWNLARKSFEEAYEKAPDKSDMRAHAALELSGLLWEQGEYDAAETHAEQALELARTLELNKGIGQLLLTRGHIEASQGELQKSERTLKICMNLAEEEGDDVRASLCKLNHRLVRELQGKSTGSESDYKEAIATLEEAGTELSAGTSLSKTAELYSKGGDKERAIQLYQKAQKKFEEADNTPAQLRNRLQIARHLQDIGNFEAAREKLDGLEDAFDSMNSRPALVDALTLYGTDALERGQVDRAKKYYDRALSVAEETESTGLIARSRLGLCELGTETDQVDGAAAECKAAAEAFEQLGIPDLEARSRAQIARLYHAQQDFNKASDAYSEAIKILEEHDQDNAAFQSALSNYRANLCQVEMNVESNGAHYICQKALDELRSDDDAEPSMVASTSYGVGITATRAGKTSKGLKYLKKAAEKADSDDFQKPELAADAHLRRGAVLAKLDGKRDEAAEAFEAGLTVVEEADQASGELDEARIELRTQLGQLELERKDWSAAKTQLEALAEEADGRPGKQAWAHHALARAHGKLDETDQKREALETALSLAREAGDDELVEKIEDALD